VGRIGAALYAPFLCADPGLVAARQTLGEFTHVPSDVIASGGQRIGRHRCAEHQAENDQLSQFM